MAVQMEVPLSEILVGEHEVRTPEEDPELVTLAQSIAEVGLVNPLTVRRTDKGYQLIAGHRRYSACVIARQSSVPVCVFEVEPVGGERLSIVENFHRRDLSPMEQAAQIAHAVDSGAMSVDELAGVFRRSVDWVRGQCEMMAWPEDVRVAVHSRRLSPSAARHLARIEDDATRMFYVETAMENGCTERTAVSWLQGWQAMRPAAEVVAEGPGPAAPGPARVAPQALCMKCGAESAAEALVPVFVCAGCVAALRRERHR